MRRAKIKRCRTRYVSTARSRIRTSGSTRAVTVGTTIAHYRCIIGCLYVIFIGTIGLAVRSVPARPTAPSTATATCGTSGARARFVAGITATARGRIRFAQAAVAILVITFIKVSITVHTVTGGIAVRIGTVARIGTGLSVLAVSAALVMNTVNPRRTCIKVLVIQPTGCRAVNVVAPAGRTARTGGRRRTARIT